MIEYIKKSWKKISCNGLSEFTLHEALEQFREIVLINRLISSVLIIMIFYLPLELIFNGFVFIPYILIELGILALTLFFISKKWFTFSKVYFFFACVLSILPMMYAVPSGAGNEYLLIPVSLIPVLLFHNKWLRSSLFVLVVIIFFIVINTREFIVPIIDVPLTTISFFRNIYLGVTFFLVFTILTYFKKIVTYLEKSNLNKNVLLQRFNSEISSQKLEIENQHHEIKSSIKYAQRIQRAILPSAKVIKGNLPNSFVYYLPKDVVAGDFYWTEKKADSVLFAAADCTGHGVPGAMVSVVCNNALNQSVKEFGFTQPSLILDKTRELVVETFSESEDDVKDGMDIALCSINFETNVLQYAGANNSVWIIRTGSCEVEEIKSDKQPIGVYDIVKPFTNHTIQLEKEDIVYIFSDGYPDQFGGPKGKKMKYKPFKEFLLSICEKSILDQKELLANHFNQWKGGLEQVDDVCVIGVKI